MAIPTEKVVGGCGTSLSHNERERYLRAEGRGDCSKGLCLVSMGDFSQLPEALRVIKAWGFQYKTVAFVWLKQNKSGKGWFFGLGFWTRGNAEICLLAIKGKPHRNSNRVHQFLISPIRGHSQKPEEAREKIVELMGDLPRVELFAREKTEGWDAWGNEVESDIEISSDTEKEWR